MSRLDNEPEIVCVISDTRLTDPESYERAYAGPGGRPLERGYHVIEWPFPADHGDYLAGFSHHGPFKSRLEAARWLSARRAQPRPQYGRAVHAALRERIYARAMPHPRKSHGGDHGHVVEWQGGD